MTEYSLPHSCGIGNDTDYKALAEAVRELTDSCIELANGRIAAGAFEPAVDKVNELSIAVTALSRSFRGR